MLHWPAATNTILMLLLWFSRGGCKGCKVLWCVCLFVCLFLCLPAHITLKTTRQNFTNFVHVAYGSGSALLGVEMRYVLPVLWMTSRFRIISLRYVMCITVEIPTKFCKTKKTINYTHRELRIGGKGEVGYLRFPRYMSCRSIYAICRIGGCYYKESCISLTLQCLLHSQSNTMLHADSRSN